MAQISYLTQDIFATDCVALVNPVNCVGVMGKGLALAFKNWYYDNYLAYHKACKENLVHLGKMFFYPREELPYWIVNFPTKHHWKDKSRLEDIECGLIALSYWLSEKKIPSIAIPPLGCGLGGLDKKDVYPLIAHHLGKIPNLLIKVVEI